MTQTPQQLAAIVKGIRPGDTVSAVFEHPDRYELTGKATLYANEFLRIGPLAIRTSDGRPATGLVAVQIVERALTEEEQMHKTLAEALYLGGDGMKDRMSIAVDLIDDLAKAGYRIVRADDESKEKIDG